MKLTITVAELKSVGACDEAIAAFRELYGESGTEDWTRDRQIELLKGPLGRFIAWAWRNGLLPLWNLSMADLSGANLYRADLSRANLSRADLSGADLCWADLSRANLSGASLSGASLSGADLSRADLCWANLSGANLSGANLSGVNLSGCCWHEDPPEGWEQCDNGRLQRKDES